MKYDHFRTIEATPRMIGKIKSTDRRVWLEISVTVSYMSGLNKTHFFETQEQAFDFMNHIISESNRARQ